MKSKIIKYSIFSTIFILWFYLAWLKPKDNTSPNYEKEFFEATNQRNYNLAFSILQKNIKAKKDSEELYLYGISFENLNLPDSAIFHFKKSLHLNPDQIKPYIRIARNYYLLKGNFDSAKIYLDLGFSIDSKNTELLIESSIFNFENKDTASSVHVLKEALKNYGNNSQVLGSLGSIYVKIGKLDSAEMFYNKALESNKEVHYLDEIHEGLGAISYSKSKLQESKMHFEKSFELVHLNENVNFHLGIIYAKENDHEKAIKHYTNALVIKNSDFKVYLNRAISYLAIEEYEKTIEDINKSIKLAPSNSDQYALRAQAKYLSNDHRGACEDMSKVEEMGNYNYKEFKNEICE
ncbi:tetratricopeptide (TPR) repeat protein [Algoriphagus sp. 4150]|uniref:tetratricopeptide repeat protein n=1 Tax=Algoriphagus sp. 4150 TaxID=2817756 RepID=UPI00285F76E1|nr:hypothetical protein [Algoriphagus sp. 4150]MDR7131366.1 tetratricopeptide (TPR) repeat protein [Algoriphagus sp. 4150]